MQARWIAAAVALALGIGRLGEGRTVELESGIADSQNHNAAVAVL